MKDSETVSKLIIEKLISNVIYAEKSNMIVALNTFSTRVFILLSVIERKKKLLPSMIIKRRREHMALIDCAVCSCE